MDKKNVTYIKAICAATIYNFATSRAKWLEPWLSEGHEFFVEPLTDDSFTSPEEHDELIDGLPDIESTYKIRLPLNPSFPDKPLGYDLSKYTERLGVSGWDYVNQLSIFGGCDYDAKGEAHAVGLTEDKLREIWDAAVSSGYFTIVLSRNNEFANTDTPWKDGFHLYLKFRIPFPAAERHDHKNNVLAAFRTVGQEVGFDFLEHADHKGDILFVYHWRKKPGTLEPVQFAEKDVDVDESLVEKRKAPKENASDEFDLSPAQQQFLDYCVANQATYTDGRLQVHTLVVANYLNENGLPEGFETFATGKEGTAPNAYGYFEPDGIRFKLYRWGDNRGNPSMEESWPDPDEGQMPHETIQLVHTFDSAFQHVGGTRSDNGAYTLSYEKAKLAFQLLGITLPELPDDRNVSVALTKGSLVVETRRNKDESFEGWAYKDGKINGRTWQYVCPYKEQNSSTFNLDECARFLVTPEGVQIGWSTKHEEGVWGSIAKGNLEDKLVSNFGINGSELSKFMGDLAAKPWFVVTEPFHDEYLPNRRWNRNAPQLAFKPTSEDRPLVHPHWDRVLNHLGKGLDDAVSQDDWCQRHEVRSGAEYLFLFIASLFRNPKQSLPYLHLFSEPKLGRRNQNAGKSSLAMAIELLMTKGSVDVYGALTEKFNGQLEGAILGRIEEHNLERRAYLKVSERYKQGRLARWCILDFFGVHEREDV